MAVRLVCFAFYSVVLVGIGGYFPHSSHEVWWAPYLLGLDAVVLGAAMLIGTSPRKSP